MTVFIAILLTGIIRAALWIRADGDAKSIFSGRWYEGGESYNKRWIWKMDYKHAFITIYKYAWFVVAAFNGIEWYHVVAVVAEGWVFTLFRHYIFQSPPDGDFWNFLRRVTA